MSIFLCAFQTFFGEEDFFFWGGGVAAEMGRSCGAGKEEGGEGVQSHAAGQGQWVRGTQPEHTWRAA